MNALIARQINTCKGEKGKEENTSDKQWKTHKMSSHVNSNYNHFSFCNVNALAFFESTFMLDAT